MRRIGPYDHCLMCQNDAESTAKQADPNMTCCRGTIPGSLGRRSTRPDLLGKGEFLGKLGGACPQAGPK